MNKAAVVVGTTVIVGGVIMLMSKAAHGSSGLDIYLNIYQTDWTELPMEGSALILNQQADYIFWAGAYNYQDKEVVYQFHSQIILNGNNIYDFVWPEITLAPGTPENPQYQWHYGTQSVPETGIGSFRAGIGNDWKSVPFKVI